jgi:hypothetical protein
LDEDADVSQSSVLNAPAKRKASNIDDLASVEKKQARGDLSILICHKVLFIMLHHIIIAKLPLASCFWWGFSLKANRKNVCLLSLSARCRFVSAGLP